MSDMPAVGARVLNFIDGHWLESDSGRWNERRDPADQDVLVASSPDSTASDASRAIDAASAALDGWSNMPPPDRGRLLFKWLRWVDERRDRLAIMLTSEEGKTLTEATGEVGRAIDILEFTAGMGRRIDGSVYPPEDQNVFCYSIRQPLGVVALISPWNFPVAIPIWKLAPALIAGNTVVLKPSPLTPLCATALVGGLEEVGIPKGVVNLVHGDSGPGVELTANPKVHGVSFTGSTKVGKMVARAASERLLKVQLELGGKNPQVILEDADLDLACAGAFAGAFGSTGQRCTATSRAIVIGGIYDKFVDEMVRRASALKIGGGLTPGVEMGPLVDSRAVNTVTQYLEGGREDGAKFLTGGGRMSGAGYERGFFCSPSIIEGSLDMRISREEVFGPVMSVFKARDLDEAIDIANRVTYGLTASIYTRDVRRVFRFANQAQVGMVYVNRPGVGGYSHAPFGGIKDSGYGGREVGPEAMNFYTETKMVYVNYQ
ncbi:MAG TPA: aldehyde dehydrogenase family protein [Blastocatellia bacterium]